jgi:hypothetical protein
MHVRHKQVIKTEERLETAIAIAAAKTIVVAQALSRRVMYLSGFAITKCPRLLSRRTSRIHANPQSNIERGASP